MSFDTTYTLERIIPRLERRFAARIKQDPVAWDDFQRRLQIHFPRLFRHLLELYQGHYDFFYYLEELLARMAQSWLERPSLLRELDTQRENAPNWFQSNQMLGGVCYVDLFAGDLNGVRQKIPYFQELGLTYLHLLPLFKTRPGDNDGGYAVGDYRQVAPRLGTVAQLRALAEELRQAGISLVLDFVLNHTADDHEWAVKARQGDPVCRQYYHIFPNRTMPDAYERHLREIFPDEHPGAFSPLTSAPSLQGRDETEWVWTTFHAYQWDLNYSNPATFNQMAAEMLFLANTGVDVLRFDALAFTWKELGTTCESLPKAHTLIRAFNAVARIASPGLIFKSEAIVHPDAVVKYIASEECQLSYNPLLMALLWNTLATREVNLLEQALRERYHLPEGTTWINYVCSHDDIGWTFSDEDAARLGINSYDHRQFLNAFYTGRFPDSFARGLPFQENTKTGDARVCGTCASLAGLEKALRGNHADEIELAIQRILLIHGIILTAGGIPVIYLGDEIGRLNDYDFRNDPAHKHDTRWVHRITTDWAQMERRRDPNTIEGRIYQGMKRIIHLRKTIPALGGNTLQVINTDNPHVLGYKRTHKGETILALANFSEHKQTVSANLLRMYGTAYEFVDQLTGETLHAGNDLTLHPYRLLLLN
ncbi:MAG: amylosucrase [Chloroflexi bacterium]|nr:amylosucrase [Chloroflexota bacterium]